MPEDLEKCYLFNLQLFAEEGDTGRNCATPRRREEARKRSGF